MEERIIWTENEVRRRLEKYNADDSLYDCQAVRMSHIKVGRSSIDDGMPRKMYRLLKRSELDKAMVDALLPHGRPQTKDQKRKVMLYNILRLIYVFDQGIEGTAFLLGRHRTTIARQEAEAVGIITGWLNRKGEQHESSA